MRWKRKEDPLDKLLSSEEFAQTAMQAMDVCLSRLPEPEACEHEFSWEFEAKMERLFAKERRKCVYHTFRRYAAAILLICLIGGGGVLTVSAEARENFFRWTRDVYKGSILYTFFEGEPICAGGTEELPVYELGWVPEGYEKIYESCDETEYGATYQLGDDESKMFLIDYAVMHSGTLIQLVGDMTKYEYKAVEVNGKSADFYRSMEEGDTSHLIWIDEQTGIIFSLASYFSETDMLHIAEEIFLCETTK